MLLAHIGFSLGLIALVISTGLILWSLRAEPGPGVVFAKVIGIIVFILAILQLLCTIYSGVRYKAYKQGRHCQCPTQSVTPQSQPQPENTENSNSNPTTPSNL